MNNFKHLFQLWDFELDSVRVPIPLTMRFISTRCESNLRKCGFILRNRKGIKKERKKERTYMIAIDGDDLANSSV